MATRRTTRTTTNRGRTRITKPAPRRRNPTENLAPAERSQLTRAIALSEKFHGSRRGVVELDATERQRLGYRYGVMVGYVDDIDYSVPWGARRGAWDHAAGDRGWWGKRSKRKMMLVVGPDGHHPQLLQNHSPMKLNPDLGLMG